MFVTNPAHGGKVTCHTCGDFIEEGEGFSYIEIHNNQDVTTGYFHKKCYNQYEHYYGLDKPID